MKVVTIGRGNVGGGLARLWREAGHEVEELGRDGGDAADADVVLVAVPGVAVPGAQISPALTKVTGLEGKIAISRRSSTRCASGISHGPAISKTRSGSLWASPRQEACSIDSPCPASSDRTAMTVTASPVRRTRVPGNLAGLLSRPGHPFPAAIEDWVAAFRSLLSCGAFSMGHAGWRS
jgi:hypothetical protein